MSWFTSFFLEIPTIKQQLILSAIMFVFWGVTSTIFTWFLLPRVRDKPWMEKRMKLIYKEYEKTFKLMGCNDTYEEIRESQIQRYPDWLFMIFQHTVGFFLCIPGIFGLVD